MAVFSYDVNMWMPIASCVVPRGLRSIRNNEDPAMASININGAAKATRVSVA